MLNKRSHTTKIRLQIFVTPSFIFILENDKHSGTEGVTGQAPVVQIFEAECSMYPFCGNDSSIVHYRFDRYIIAIAKQLDSIWMLQPSKVTKLIPHR
jgi:hypothetical protein